MAKRLVSPRLADIIEAIEHIRSTLKGISLESFEADWMQRWLVERGVEIISEASRHLPEDLKARNPAIPWRKVASIGNVIRHEYRRTAPELLWKLVMDDLPALEIVCRTEFAKARELEKD